jgi:structural maintenance of chromosome 2
MDEIDAALDLSHTQNIGQMIKTHFSQSQFIVVSLKEGMFNNANVIFRTRFVDGTSTVIRTMNNNGGKGVEQSKALIAADETDKENVRKQASTQRKRPASKADL